MTTPAKREKRRKRFNYTVLMIMASMLVVAATSIVYSNHVGQVSDERAMMAQRDSDRRWCGLLTIMDNAYNQSSQAPQTAIGKAIAEGIHELKVAFSC